MWWGQVCADKSIFGLQRPEKWYPASARVTGSWELSDVVLRIKFSSSARAVLTLHS